MSCWVVPSLAADFWHVSVEHVMHLIRSGAVTTKAENGFTFVDVLPQVGTPSSQALPKEQRPPTPPTYVPLTPAELEMLREGTGEELLEDDQETWSQVPDEETSDMTASAWKRARHRIGQLRRPPIAA